MHACNMLCLTHLPEQKKTRRVHVSKKSLAHLEPAASLKKRINSMYADMYMIYTSTPEAESLP
jgi:hypothetical protein